MELDDFEDIGTTNISIGTDMAEAIYEFRHLGMQEALVEAYTEGERKIYE